MKANLQRRIQRYGWDRAAGKYEAGWQVQLHAAQQQLLELAGLQPGERVLDVACGTGLVTFQAAKAVGTAGHVKGTDISEKMLALASKKADSLMVKNITFECKDAEKPGEKGNYFDAVLCSLGMMYFPDPLRAMRQMFFSLKPGGRAALLVWGDRTKCGWAEIFPIVDRRVASDVCPLFFQLGTGVTLKNTMIAAGLKDIIYDRHFYVLHYKTPEEACEAAFAGGPVSLAYQKFNQTVREEVHAEYLASIEAYRKGNGYEIPGEFVTALGFKK